MEDELTVARTLLEAALIPGGQRGINDPGEPAESGIVRMTIKKPLLMTVMVAPSVVN